jgi:4-amino-4-deoxy-L-arabinose transferase-like glycosyltransferase
MTTLSSEAEASCPDVQTHVAAEPTCAPSTPTQAWRNYREWVVLAALAVVMIAQLWSSIRQLSITSDEVDHLHAAFRYLQCNDFGWNPEHPPLVKIVAALPLAAMSINDPIPHACGLANSKEIDFLAGHDFVFANPERMLTAARRAVSLFSILLLLTVWFFARKMFGLPAAMIAGVLVAFDPNFLANGALVTTDVAAALGFLLAVYELYCYATEPNSARLLALGLATGLALCVKHSMVLLAIVLPVLLFSDALLCGREGLRRRLLHRAGALLAVAAIAFVVLWTCYGFRYAARPGGAAIWSAPQLPRAHGAVATRLIPQLQSWHVMPQAYLGGLQDVLVQSEVGDPSFLLGRLYLRGNWFYFPVAAVIKYTLPVLLMLLVSVLSWRFWRHKSRELLFLILPALIYLAFSMNSKLNIGSRHLLSVLPLLTIFAAAGAWSLAGSRKWTMAVLVALLVFHAASSLHAYPNYLSYSNELWGGPGETYRFIANSDVDWGQAQKMARDYIARTHPPNCFFLRTYNNLNSDYGIPCRGISEIQWDQLETPFTGTMIVSSTIVDGVGLGRMSVPTRRVFKDLKPVAKIGGSALLVYKGTFDLSPIVAFQLLVHARTVGEQDPQLALELGQQAAQIDPTSGDAHVEMCASYRDLGQQEKAQQECDLGLALVRKDPQYGPDQIQYLENFITRNGLKIHDSAAMVR